MKKIAILGMGAMGQRIARNFLAANFEVTIWNRTADHCRLLVERGAKALVSPRLAAQDADVVIAMVRDDAASAEVWLDAQDGAVHGLKPGAIAVECSTLSLAWCRELASALCSHGFGFIDAPVVGSRPQAEAKQLIHLVGGDDRTIQDIEKVLMVNAATIVRAGKTGHGMALKLAVNTLFGIQVAALGEVLGFLAQAGINKSEAIEALTQLPVASPALKGAAGLMASENYAPLFPVELVHKDFEYAVRTANDVKAETPITRVVCHLFSQAIDAGYSQENIHAIEKAFQKRLGRSS